MLSNLGWRSLENVGMIRTLRDDLQNISSAYASTFRASHQNHWPHASSQILLLIITGINFYDCSLVEQASNLGELTPLRSKFRKKWGKNRRDRSENREKKSDRKARKCERLTKSVFSPSVPVQIWLPLEVPGLTKSQSRHVPWESRSS